MICIVVTGCATPTERIEQLAGEHGFARLELEGRGFRHVAFATDLAISSEALHVYVEHDGSPWLEGGTRIAADPTPRVPLALELMSVDRGPRLYLGRPCYLGKAAVEACNPALWTYRRYAPEVVDSMVSALARFLDDHPYRRVVLIGHSGGGTLAWLMARDARQVSHVFTIAANLDVDEWTRFHGFSPLRGSLNPADMPDLPPEILQVHYAGGRDDQVPPRIVEAFARTHGRARAIIIRPFDHVCCWAREWPGLLTPLESASPSGLARQ